MGEKYIGTKFKTIYLDDFRPNKTEKIIIKQLIKIGKDLGKLGFKDKNGGNFSFKTKRGIIIKTTGSYPHQLKPDDFVLLTKISGDKVFVYGKCEPSSEARLHFKIYNTREDVKCVLHSHDNLAINLKEKIKGPIYIKEYPYGSLESARAIKRAASKGDYIIMKNHGVFALGKSIKATFNLIYKYHEKFKTIKNKTSRDSKIRKK